MDIKFPKDNFNRKWTQHVKNKMVFYRISESKILRTIRNYSRKQGGLAPNTVCYMMRNDKLKNKEEVWVMAQEDAAKSGKVTIISAWIYPGISKPDLDIPIPVNILEEILREFV